MGPVQWPTNNNNKHSVHVKDKFKPFCQKLQFTCFSMKNYRRENEFFSCINYGNYSSRKKKNLEKRVRDTYICIPRGKQKKSRQIPKEEPMTGEPVIKYFFEISAAFRSLLSWGRKKHHRNLLKKIKTKLSQRTKKVIKKYSYSSKSSVAAILSPTLVYKVSNSKTIKMGRGNSLLMKHFK